MKSLHYGAHNPGCNVYRVSGDDVDREHDELNRDALQAPTLLMVAQQFGVFPDTTLALWPTAFNLWTDELREISRATLRPLPPVASYETLAARQARFENRVRTSES